MSSLVLTGNSINVLNRGNLKNRRKISIMLIYTHICGTNWNARWQWISHFCF